MFKIYKKKPGICSVKILLQTSLEVSLEKPLDFGGPGLEI